MQRGKHRRGSPENALLKRKAFRLRMAGETQADIAKKVGVSVAKISKWERGWIDSKGRKHAGWKEEMTRILDEQEKAEYTEGLAVKQKRIETYDRLAQMAIKKIERDFPGIVAKTPADAATLINEVRKLGLAIAKEKDELPRPGARGAQTNITMIKNDFTLQEFSDRFEQRTKVAEAKVVKAVEPGGDTKANGGKADGEEDRGVGCVDGA